MYVCILNQDGEIMLHRNMQASPEPCLKAIAPYREDVVISVERMFTWYWLADLCAQHGIAFVLGPALYMQAMHGGKAKNDKIDAHKMAVLLRGGMLPQAYVYRAVMRATRDYLRRRLHLTRKCAGLRTHVRNTNRQDHLPELRKPSAYKANREGVAERFPNPAVQKRVAVDRALIDSYARWLSDVELTSVQTARGRSSESTSISVWCRHVGTPRYGNETAHVARDGLRSA
jgi:hypothetical protein